MVKLTDRPAMTIAYDMGRKATKTNKLTTNEGGFSNKHVSHMRSNFISKYSGS